MPIERAQRQRLGSWAAGSVDWRRVRTGCFGKAGDDGDVTQCTARELDMVSSLAVHGCYVLGLVVDVKSMT
jgi:hypothetical protein